MRCLTPGWIASSVLLLMACAGETPEVNPAPRPDAQASLTTDAAQESASTDAVTVDANLDATLDGDPGDACLDVIRVATFNTHLLFDPNCDTGNCDPSDFEQQPTQAQFEARADQVAAAIVALDVDVVLLQEVETQVSLDALSARLSDRFPTAVLGEIKTPGSLDVAVLAAGPLIGVRRHRDKPITRPDGTSTTFSREFFEVHVSIHDRRVVAFAAHFRSKNNDDPGRRIAEANAARDIVIAATSQYPDAMVVMGGDLNDTPESATILALEQSADMLRVAKDRPNASVATYRWEGQLQAIDHIFLDTASKGRYVAGSASAMRDSGEVGWGGSDHAALRAEFLWAF